MPGLIYFKVVSSVLYNQITFMRRTLTTAIAFLLLNVCCAQTIIKSNDSHIHYAGRVKFLDDAAELTWSGSTAAINFNGTGIKAILKAEADTNYFKVIVDGHILPDILIDSVKRTYTLVSDLPAGRHHLELFKRTEWHFGKTWRNVYKAEQFDKAHHPIEIAHRRLDDCQMVEGAMARHLIGLFQGYAIADFAGI